MIRTSYGLSAFSPTKVKKKHYILRIIYIHGCLTNYIPGCMYGRNSCQGNGSIDVTLLT